MSTIVSQNTAKWLRCLAVSGLFVGAVACEDDAQPAAKPAAPGTEVPGVGPTDVTTINVTDWMRAQAQTKTNDEAQPDAIDDPKIKIIDDTADDVTAFQKLLE